MRKLGVAEEFIERVLQPSIHGIFEPGPQAVLDAGLATEVITAAIVRVSDSRRQSGSLTGPGCKLLQQ